MWRLCCGDVVGFSRISLSCAICASMLSMVEYNGCYYLSEDLSSSASKHLTIKSANRSILSECTDAGCSVIAFRNAFNSSISSGVSVVQRSGGMCVMGHLCLCEYHNILHNNLFGITDCLKVRIRLLKCCHYHIASTF